MNKQNISRGKNRDDKVCVVYPVRSWSFLNFSLTDVCIDTALRSSYYIALKLYQGRDRSVVKYSLCHWGS